MIRRSISKTAGEKKIFGVSFNLDNILDMTISEFEDQIEAKVTDSRRLLHEAMQLESYLFSPKLQPLPPPKKKEANYFPNRNGPFNDWFSTLSEVL